MSLLEKNGEMHECTGERKREEEMKGKIAIQMGGF